jgi:Tfp pilus assembly protein PilV
MNCPKINFLRRGISLIEVVVALFILGIIGGALVAISLQVASATNSAKLKNEAAAYAQEGIEQARNVKSQGWANLSPGCYSDGSFVSAGDCVNGTAIGTTPFKRYVNVTAPTASSFKIASVVRWKEKGTQKNVEIDTYFYQYQ